MIDYEFGAYLRKELAKASKKVEQLTEAYQETGEPQRGLNRMEYKVQAYESALKQFEDEEEQNDQGAE
ncbi:MAG: hypothetical protein PHX50_17195, partial [Massilibacteroides sp.]|nr:hypothetical protein [Massilibacteroides sp.]